MLNSLQQILIIIHENAISNYICSSFTGAIVGKYFLFEQQNA